jgi:TRAP-type uncharacterized transport system substrate-binding protein
MSVPAGVSLQSVLDMAITILILNLFPREDYAVASREISIKNQMQCHRNLGATTCERQKMSWRTIRCDYYFRACFVVAALAVWCLSGVADAQKLLDRDHGKLSLVERTNSGVVELVTGPDATSVQMAQDLASVLDDGATRRILPVVGRGSLQNLIDLKLLRGIDIGVVRTDVLEDARKQAPYLGMVESLTYIAKFYDEELHVLARAAIQNIAELEGKRVNFVGAATPIGPAVFKLLSIEVEPTSDDLVTSLQKLKNGQIAALVYVGGKPISLFGSLRKQDDLHFLPIPFTMKLRASTYIPTRLTAEDYPDLVAANAPVDTLAVSTVLCAAPLQPKSDRYRNVANFVEAFFTQFPRLQEAGHHAKWKDMDLAAAVPGWKRFPAAETWLQRNAVASSAPLSEQELREAFARFLDERSRLSGAAVMPAAQKDEMFNLFQQWLKSQRR